MASVDVPYVASFLSLPPLTVTTALDKPSSDLVTAILAAVARRAQKADEDEAEKLRLDVALESAVRSADNKTKAAKTTIEKQLQEVGELRAKLKEQEDAKSALETELQNVKSSSSSSSSDLQALRSKIAALEQTNREALAALDAKTTSNDRLNEELSLSQQKALELRREIASLEQAAAAAASGNSSAKFREQTLQQELRIAKQSEQWHEKELKTKTAEYREYRKEKGAKITELQRQNDDNAALIDSMKKTEASLRKRLGELEQNAEDSLKRVQQLQNQAISAEESFRQELASATRLAQLHEESTKAARERIKDLEGTIDHLRGQGADEISLIQSELEKEHREREAAETKIKDLEEHIDRLENDLASQNTHAFASQSMNGAATPTRPGSVMGRSFGFSPPNSQMKGSMSVTQLYGELSTAQTELSAERRRNAKLEAHVDDLLQQFEAKAPEFREMQAEHDRLLGDIDELSKILEEVQASRDELQRATSRREGEVNGLTAESQVLKQQLRDLSAHVRLLTTEIQARDAGLPGITAAEREELERIARQDDEEDDTMTDADRIISQRFLFFKDVKELQAQNQNLLLLSRDLGQQLKSEQERAGKSQSLIQTEEIAQLNARIERYKDEIKALITRSESYIQERDTMRRMLQRRGQGEDGPATPFNRSVMSTDQSPFKEIDFTSTLRDVQSSFDAYREETSTDRKILKEQVDNLAKERSELQAQVSRAENQVSLSGQRYEMLEANFKMLTSENSELQKRAQHISESAAKQDVRTQQVAEELVEARSMSETLRTENANLKAEKSLWKSRETRLTEQNDGLTSEKSQLSSFITNLQNMANERERSDSETRRRLQGQVESLETELQSTKRKLSDETEESKQAALRKEYDMQHNQKRIDDLMTSLSNTREELVAAKTAKDHLQARIDELAIELRAAEERVTVLQPRPTPRAPVPAEPAEETLTREQDLALEVTELKRSLEYAKADLESAKANEEQYKSISQAAEEELQSLNETHASYKEEMEKTIEEKEAKVRELSQRIEDISAELANTNSELSALRDSQSERDRHAEEAKAVLESEITRLKDEDDKHATAARFLQQDLRTQAQIAQEAQTNYDRELILHAEAAQSLQKLRGDHNTLRTEMLTLKTEADAAKATIASNESSWQEMRETFDRELAEIRLRRDDLQSQNRLLHQQLENVNSQISTIQQEKSFDENSQSDGAQGLQEIIKYLRREKEIVDVQWELSIQDAKRIKQQLEYCQSQLDETRLKLEEERRRSEDGPRSTAAHKDLMEKLNELNVFRESSIVLRNESRQAHEQLAAANTKIETLTAQLQPLEQKLQEAESDKELAQGEVKLIQADRDRWQARTQTILQKYDRIDPTEHEALKEQVSTLQAELATEKEKVQPMQAQIDAVEERIRVAKEEAEAPLRDRNARIIEQSKEKVRQMRLEIQTKTAEAQAANEAKTAAEGQLASLKEELEKARAPQDVVMADSGQDARVAELETKVQELTSTVTTLNATITAKDTSLKELQITLEAEKANVSNLQKQLQDAPAPAADESIKQELATVKAELETLRTTSSAAAAVTTDGEKSVADQIAEQVETLKASLEEKHNERMKQLEDRTKARSDQMKTQLNQRLRDGRAADQAQLKQEFEAAEAKSRAEHEEAITKLKTEHAAEIEKLNKDFDMKLAQEKAIWQAESGQPASSQPTNGQPAPASLDNLTDAQLREFIGKNATVKNILRNNINSGIAKERDSIGARVKAEHEKAMAEKLQEFQQKADQQRQQEVSLASKRMDLQLSMARGQLKAVQVKYEVVSQAAKTTPQKAVVEVWTVAEATKPPVVQAAPAKPVQAQPAPVPASPVNAVPKPAPAPVAPVAASPAPVAAMAPAVKAEPEATNGTPAGGAAIQNMMRGAMQSGIPRGGRGGPAGGRGQSQLPRGRGRGRGGAQQAAGAPPANNMNAQAKQFVPNKRPREEGDAGEAAKRPRGGGNAGA